MGSKGDGPPLEMPTGPTLSTEDMNALRAVLAWHPGAEKDLNMLLDAFKDLNLGTLKDYLKDLEA